MMAGQRGVCRRGRSWAVAALVVGALFLGAPGVSAQEGPVTDGVFITVQNPIDNLELSRIREVTEEARRNFRAAVEQGKLPKDKQRLTVVYDFNPDSKPSGTTQYGNCRDLADYLLKLSDTFTIAWVHGDISRHTLLPVLACDQLVMAPTASIGNEARDTLDPFPSDPELFYKDDRVGFYEKLALRRSRSPAIVLKMLDENMEVMEGKILETGRVTYVDRRRPLPPGVAIVREQPVLPRGQFGRFSAAEAQRFGLCNVIAENRQAVAELYKMSPGSLREDPLQGRTREPWRVEVRGPFNQVLEESIKRRINRVLAHKGNFIILQLDCGGGDPVIARKLAQFISELDQGGKRPVMTVAYITDHSHDLAALLALACNQIVMDKRGKLGDFERFLQDKAHANFEGPLGIMLKELAEKKFYSGNLARGFAERGLTLYAVHGKVNASERAVLTEQELNADKQGNKHWVEDGPPIKQKDQPFSLNADDAKKYGFCQSIVDDPGKLYERYGLKADGIRQAEPDWLEQVRQFLQSPTMVFFLVTLGISCLTLELKMPGVVLPGILSALCFILFFWSHANLAFTWLALLLFLLGLLLIGVEIFVMPGIAVLGVSGVLMVISGLALATMERWPQSESEWVDTLMTLGRFGLALIGAIVLAVAVGRYLPHIPYANRLMLAPPTERAELAADGGGLALSDKQVALLGAIGVTATPLRPAGMVRFGDDYVDVIAEGSYVEAGTRVQVIEIEGNRIVVKEV